MLLNLIQIKNNLKRNFQKKKQYIQIMKKWIEALVILVIQIICKTKKNKMVKNKKRIEDMNIMTWKHK